MHATQNLIGGLVLLSLGAAACSAGGPGSARPANISALPNDGVATTSRSPSIPASSAPIRADGTGVTVLPAPDGPFAVGVVDLPLPNAIAYYPARAGTGDGQHLYLDPTIAAAIGGPAAAFATLVTSSRPDGVPLATDAARPVVVLAPGFGSLIALSTALAEHLASNGYVVVAVQTDIASEAATMPPPTPAQATARFDQIRAVLDLIDTPAFSALVGPVDRHQVAVGGHSYAGSVAFNISLHDQRVAAVFDLDGHLFGEAATTPTRVPSLVVTSSGSGSASDPVLRQMVAAGPHAVAVGLLGAQHFDLTDAAALGNMLEAAGVPTQVGSIGAVGTSATSTIVQRFLDAVLGDRPRMPTAAHLVDGLASTTAAPFGTGA